MADERSANCCPTDDSREGSFDHAILGGGSAATVVASPGVGTASPLAAIESAGS